MKKLIASVIAAAAIATPALTASANGGPEQPSVYDIAVGASKGFLPLDRNGGDFDILLLAVQVTGLKGALDDPSANLTVFAPTDATFRATFGGSSELGTLYNVLKAVNFDLGTLKTVLLYHVTGVDADGVKGASLAEVASLIASGNGSAVVPMLAGGNTVASLSATGPQLDGTNSNPSSIVATDIGLGTSSNGVIHVLNGSVLLP
jgi:uncharacterized surface protein with fasciclin (FAS1) repeats